MCLTIPSKVISTKGKTAVVEIDERQETVSMKICLAKAGDYVTIQNAYIIQKINKNQAKEIFKFFKKGGK
ncbi:MAG: HypC/HybG/HupF family hydrogenase formation chaperone [bacterium]